MVNVTISLTQKKTSGGMTKRFSSQRKKDGKSEAAVVINILLRRSLVENFHHPCHVVPWINEASHSFRK
jgi:hypothetical protein